MEGDLKPMIGGIISGIGSALVAASYLYPPLLPVGAIISAFGKWYMGAKVADKDAVVHKVKLG